jgi:hypothetical protein
MAKAITTMQNTDTPPDFEKILFMLSLLSAGRECKKNFTLRFGIWILEWNLLHRAQEINLYTVELLAWSQQVISKKPFGPISLLEAKSGGIIPICIECPTRAAQGGKLSASAVE